MEYSEILGIIAGIATTGSFIPQAYKVYKTKKTQDLSVGMFVFFSCGLLLWIVYGVIHHSISIIMANVITFVLAMYILIMKIRHG